MSPSARRPHTSACPCLGRRTRSTSRNGAMLILMLLMVIVVLVMTVFTVDVAYMDLVKTELRTASDAAARAGSEALMRTQSIEQARQAAISVAAANRVAGAPLQLAPSDVILGAAVPNASGTFVFAPNDNAPNAVRILARRTSDSPSGPVRLFLGSLLGTATFEPQLRSTTTSKVRDIALVLDRSGSMLQENRINDLKRAVGVFLDVLEQSAGGERVSLISYSTTATKDQSVTGNLTLIRAAANRMPAAGFTAIGQGLQMGSDSLVLDSESRAFAEKTIILMTDGIENRAPFTMPVLNGILQHNQTIHTITFGSDADQGLMRQVARVGSGTHSHAPNGQALREILESIARALAVLTIE